MVPEGDYSTMLLISTQSWAKKLEISVSMVGVLLPRIWLKMISVKIWKRFILEKIQAAWNKLNKFSNFRTKRLAVLVKYHIHVIHFALIYRRNAKISKLTGQIIPKGRNLIWWDRLKFKKHSSFESYFENKKIGFNSHAVGMAVVQPSDFEINFARNPFSGSAAWVFVIILKFILLPFLK